MAVPRIGRLRYWLVLVVVLVVVLAASTTAVVLSSASAAGPKGCTNATVKGAYGFIQSGVIVQAGARTDWAALSQKVFDGEGHFDTKVSASIGGNIAHLTVTGTYEVSPDCTMTMDGIASNGTPLHRDIVIVDGGRQMFTIGTDAGWVATGHMIRQDSED